MTNKERYAKKIKQYETTVAAIGVHKFEDRYGINVMDSLECAADAFRRQQRDSIVAGFLYEASCRFDRRPDNNGFVDLFEDALHQV